ncbi:acetoin utilization protein AcuA [Melghirimyces profundicolus]|uniref:Acetoin utilization protein AcuA n=1 Tax=Melghirimyces profundicolus TaxID=1242148 RepID=A0A2T6BGM0_9BACL|nr:GNAT family N-acetyltransferase [Melghirimyces profundicolus]PTX55200.1 acetoin utilization protein AcuA [Melghirimyces profundicolus]
MEHRKEYHRTVLQTDTGELTVEGPVSPEQLRKYPFHSGLVAFRPPDEQREALIGISRLTEGRIIVARTEKEIVGYVTFLHPDPLEHWSSANMEDLLELGAIEVAAPYRQYGVARALLRVTFMDPHMENYMVFSTEYYWHWDLKGTGLSVWEYRDVMEKVMGTVGLEWVATDDPEITAHPANCLMARIGKNVPLESMEKFDRLRFHYRFLY